MNNNWIIKNSPPVECGILGESLKFPSRNIYCVGRNYRDHAKEMGSDPDREQPFFFICNLESSGCKLIVESPTPCIVL